MAKWKWRKPPKSEYPAVSAGGRFRREHVDVAERALGKRLPKGAQVHHVDGDKRNNVRRNLVICQDGAYHDLLEVRQRILAAGGDPNTDSICSACRKALPRTMFGVRKSGPSSGKPLTYCRRCSKDRSAQYRQRVIQDRHATVGAF